MRDIAGTWRLVATAAHDPDGAPLPAPYGPTPLGVVSFTARGWMLAALSDGRAVLPAGVVREYVSYCGHYSFDGRTLVTRVDAASDPARVGTDQVRRVSFDGDLMVLRPPTDRAGGVVRQRVLTWERTGPA